MLGHFLDLLEQGIVLFGNGLDLPLQFGTLVVISVVLGALLDYIVLRCEELGSHSVELLGQHNYEVVRLQVELGNVGFQLVRHLLELIG